jgi:hypothetical protein
MTTRTHNPTTATDLLEGVTYAASGIGIAFMSFLAVIPGLLPTVALTAVLVAVLLIPLLVVGALLGLLFLGARLVLRAGRGFLRPVRSTGLRCEPTNKEARPSPPRALSSTTGAGPA